MSNGTPFSAIAAFTFLAGQRRNDAGEPHAGAQQPHGDADVDLGRTALILIGIDDDAQIFRRRPRQHRRWANPDLLRGIDGSAAPARRSGRSASSSVILLSDSICRMERRLSIMVVLLEDVDEDRGVGTLDFDTGAVQRQQGADAFDDDLRGVHAIGRRQRQP